MMMMLTSDSVTEFKTNANKCDDDGSPQAFRHTNTHAHYVYAVCMCACVLMVMEKI